MLVHSFLKEICYDYGMPEKKISKSALEALKKQPWTGNVRELRNMVERLIILSDTVITEANVATFANPTSTTTQVNGDHHQKIDYNQFTNFQDYKDFMEREFIKFKLVKNNWNVSKTAEEIEIQRSHLYSKIEKFGLVRNEQ